MRKVNVIILRTAGTNCDLETEFAFRLVGAETDLCHINQLIRGKKSLKNYQIMAIPGGFSYGDDIAAGKILANELKYLLKREIDRFIKEGNLVIGICNGFQVLIKAGLLPNSQMREQETTLTFNDSAKFEDRWCHLRINPQSPCLFTKNMEGIIYLPVAHSEGKFLAKSKTISQLKRNHQIVLQYVDAQGHLAGYPDNPNSSLKNIAGICDSTGRIFGLMPHPERHIFHLQHPSWTRVNWKEEGDGLKIFKNALEFIRKES